MRGHRSLSLLVGLILLGAIAESRADVYYGDLCWQLNNATDISWQAGGVQTSQSTSGQAILRLGTYQKEGGHFVFYGKVSSADSATVAPVHGNAEVQGDSVLMTLTYSGTGSTDKFNDIVNAVLNAQTLNGTFAQIGTHYNNSGPLGIHYGDGTMTRITCP